MSITPVATRHPGAALETLREAVATLPAISLAEVVAEAELQTRTDRKYLVPTALFGPLVSSLDDHRVLEIDGQRTFRYESVYFDTEHLTSYRGAAHGRRHKFKVRTRTYLDSELCVLEVKTEGGREQTVKERITHSLSAADRLDGVACRFIEQHVRLQGAARDLRPVLTTSYARTTLVDTHAGSRVTCDADLTMSQPDQHVVEMGDHVLVETKSATGAGEVDRLLWRQGVRPVTISKYCVGLAALNPGLPCNRWHRTLSRHFGDVRPSGVSLPVSEGEPHTVG